MDSVRITLPSSFDCSSAHANRLKSKRLVWGKNVDRGTIRNTQLLLPQDALWLDQIPRQQRNREKQRNHYGYRLVLHIRYDTRGSAFLEFLSERQKCGTAEFGRPERSERETLPAVATTDLFG